MIYLFAAGTPLFSTDTTGAPDLAKPAATLTPSQPFDQVLEVDSSTATSLQYNGEWTTAFRVQYGPYATFWVLKSMALGQEQGAPILKSLTSAQMDLVYQGHGSGSPQATSASGGGGSGVLFVGGLAAVGGLWWLARRKK